MEPGRSGSRSWAAAFTIGGELLLLRVGGVDLDVEMLEHAVEMLVQPGRIQQGAHEAGAVPAAIPAVREGIDADAGRHAGDEGRRPLASGSDGAASGHRRWKMGSG